MKTTELLHQELEGADQLELKSQAIKLALKLLARKKLDADQFSSATFALCRYVDFRKLWKFKDLVTQAFTRLNPEAKRESAVAMFDFYYMANMNWQALLVCYHYGPFETPTILDVLDEDDGENSFLIYACGLGEKAKADPMISALLDWMKRNIEGVEWN